MKACNPKRGFNTAGILLSVCLVIAPGPASALELSYSADPSAILARISERGVWFVVGELYDHPDDWEYVLGNIQKGNEVWLRVAVRLQPGTDAGPASMLCEAVSVALIHAPERVLRLAVPTFRLEEICGGRPDPLPTYPLAADELERQIKSVANVKDADLIERRDRCLRELEESRVHLKRFFEVN